MKETHITLYVQVTIPVGLAYDGPLPDAKQLRADALANFVDHPAIKDPEFLSDLNGYVDSIGNGEIEV